jgi:hypothetical protein
MRRELALTAICVSLMTAAGCADTTDDSDKPAAGDGGETGTDGADGETDGTDGADGSDSGEPGPTWHGEVAPIFARHCSSCHDADGVGTPTWESPEQVAEWAPAIRAAVEGRSMPPWQASADCNSYEGDFSLSPDQIQTIVDWADTGAELGDPETAAALPEPFAPPELPRVDAVLEMPEAYTPSNATGPDDYRCMLIEWPFEEDVWVTGYQVQPGDAETVHHVIPFLIAPSDADQYRALDEADSGPGYTCYGGPGGDVNTLIETRWLGSWAPGTGAALFPEERGIRVQPGSLVAFQVHYNVTTDDPGPDQSAIELMVETEPQRWADIQPWTEVTWVLGVGMEIPAQTDDVEHVFEYTLGPRDQFSFYSASIHMHTLGKKGRMSIVHDDGSETCLVDYQAYDFNWQRSYNLTEPVEVGPGDTVRVSCTWDNPTDEMVSWGDGTGDEMCLGVSFIAD